MNRLFAKPKPMDPVEYAEQVFARADRRIRWSKRIAVPSALVLLGLGAVEYFRLFGTFNVVDLVLVILIGIAAVATVIGGAISGVFFPKSAAAPLPKSTTPVEVDETALRDHTTNLLAYQVILLGASTAFVIAWVLQLAHPNTAAPGQDFVALLPAVAFLCVAASGAVNIFYRARRTQIREIEKNRW